MNIIILGSPGSGKGTQAEKIAKYFGLYYFQSGELARDLAKENKSIQKIYNSGKLIPEQEMSMYVINHLTKKKSEMKNILFEGFPRFVSQYEALEGFLKNDGDDIDAVILIDISEKEAIKRISSRRICSKCGEVYNLITNPPAKQGFCKCGGKLIHRDDDKPEAIKVRFKYYRQNTKKLVDYLDKKRKLIKVDGERPIGVIFDEIVEKIKKKTNEK